MRYLNLQKVYKLVIVDNIIKFFYLLFLFLTIHEDTPIKISKLKHTPMCISMYVLDWTN